MKVTMQSKGLSLLRPQIYLYSASGAQIGSVIGAAYGDTITTTYSGITAGQVYYLVAEGVVSAADVDTALCWGPGLRWGIMGNMMLNHLGGGPGGIEHFFDQFTGPMTAWWKVLGSPVLTPEVQKKLIDSVHAEVGSRTIEELEAERDEILLGLLELRTKRPQTAAPRPLAAAE